ncbi:molybdopterin molybdotransferase MoeA [Ornithinimicrobium sp. F0845]|uniref:molybdopterin molybdotransferase MoeA n=1 Tax=Ornithinimicrobium sp. F0845 TaxID=2926412 RepID=UPI001FF36D80|nr:molybdopterin molybdotransferase MoeA [Ornithinimicrobium sp. F0845]
MTTVDEHLESVLAAIEPVPEVEVPLHEALGLVLTRDVTSDVDLPRFANSAMDGYAVRAAELAGVDAEHPRSVPVLGDIPAGSTARHTHREGSVWRILTGAPVPEGADAVVRVEDTDGRPREVLISRAPEVGDNIRPAGEDVRAGDVILRRGTRVGAPQIAVLAAAGVAEVAVTGPVRVVVLSTGDELVPAGQPVGPGQINDSNGPMLAALVRSAGAEVVHTGHLPDDEKVIKKTLDHHLRQADAVITSGGVSKGGSYDAVKAVLTGSGSMEFTEVGMQPGKPQGFGLLGKRRVPVFTLPGNPVSVLVSFEVFLRPALARLGGRTHTPVTVPAVVARGWSSPEGRQQYHRVRLSRDASGQYAAEPVGGPGSHLVGGLALADGLAVVPAEVTDVATGSAVPVLPLRPLEEIEADLVSSADEDRSDRSDGEAG